METKYTTCTFCDGGCAVKAEVEDDGSFKVMPVNPDFPAICSKAHKIDEYRLHPDRVVKPLKNVGVRGEAQWVEVTWDEALDEVAERLQKIIAQYGPEAVAFAETPLNHGYGGITRRLMNCIGTPNYTAPTQLCMGNTAQVHRMVYGWLSLADWANTDCVVYFGQDRDMERWPAEYLRLVAAQERGAKLIVVDPRLTDTAKRADYHLRIRYGTDAALVLGWLNIIIEEELYNKEFVAEQCIGFEELRDRVAQYPPEKVADICSIDVELIYETARVYATSERGIIPWGATADMQVNSTSLLQGQCILRAICGFLNVSETVFGPAMGGQGNAQVSRFDWLEQEQREKQLGAKEHPLLTFNAARFYDDANEKIGIDFVPDILAESVACQPAQLFAAMRGEGPYDVKAMFVAANNTVMSYANQLGIIDAFMNQDLVVVFENWMTPTAQLADFVLPGDMWAERSTFGKAYDIAPIFAANQAICNPVGQCKSWYFVVKGLADRLGFTEQFPWEDKESFYDWRLEDLGITWNEANAAAPAPIGRTPVAMGKFVTPTGKVELKSTILDALGFDPLPSYDEPKDPGAKGGNYPYVVFAGLRERKSYNTGLRQIESLRKLNPEPLLLINPADVEAEGLTQGEFVCIESAYGKVNLMVEPDPAQPAGTLRIPHGWWKPEAKQGLANGLSQACTYNDGMLFPDKAWNLDGPQGVPNLRGGIHGKLMRLS